MFASFLARLNLFLHFLGDHLHACMYLYLRPQIQALSREAVCSACVRSFMASLQSSSLSGWFCCAVLCCDLCCAVVCAVLCCAIVYAVCCAVLYLVPCCAVCCAVLYAVVRCMLCFGVCCAVVYAVCCVVCCAMLYTHIYIDLFFFVCKTEFWELQACINTRKSSGNPCVFRT